MLGLKNQDWRHLDEHQAGSMAGDEYTGEHIEARPFQECPDRLQV